MTFIPPARPLRRRPFFNRRFGGLLLLALLSAGLIALYAAALNERAGSETFGGATRIIDGDSLMVGGVEVRLYGIDAPELHQRCDRDGREVQCGREAARALVALIAGQPVSCRRRDRDRYGRTVAICTVEEVDLGRAMVAAGHAVAYGAYSGEEATAREARRGLWAGDFIRPREWRERDRARRGG